MTSAFSAKAAEHVEALGIFEIQRHRALVAVQVLEIRAMARAARLFACSILQQRIDLDDIGAPIRQLPHAGRPGSDAGEIKHGEADRAWEARGVGIKGDSGRVERETGVSV